MGALRFYLRNCGVMICVAMPLGAVGLAIVTLLVVPVQAADGLLASIGQALTFVYFWGIVTAVPTSLAHTALLRARATSWGMGGIAVATVLGGIAGAITPTFFTGIWHWPAIVVGAGIGAAYGGIVRVLRGRPPEGAGSTGSRTGKPGQT